MRGPGKYEKRRSKFEARNSKSVLAALAMAAIFCDANVVWGASDEIYGRIPARNLFGLHEPIIQQPEPVKPQLPKIQLNGIVTVPSKLAFLKTQSPTKPGEQPQGEQSYTLGEGQREAGIEVLEINERTGTIRVNNAGTEMTIGFDKDAAKAANTTPPLSSARSPGVPPNIGARIRSMNPGTSGYHKLIPPQPGQQIQGGTVTPPQQQPNLPQIEQQNPPAEKPLTPDEQAILREIDQAVQRSPQPQ